MRIGIFSDIHGNLEALDTVLKYLKENNIHKYICLGDIVGYGPNPNECVERIRELKCPVVMGNHDYVAIGKGDVTLFNVTARNAIEWTQGQLTKENLDFLSTLPFIYRTKHLIAVHSTPRDPERWEYVLTMDSALQNMEYYTEPVCFIGHSHTPFFLELDTKGNAQIIKDNPMILKDDYRYLVNAGSVGQPRDNNPKSAFAIYDTTQKTITLLRVAYDISTTQEKIINAELPIQLAQRLQNGF
jgi:predicted phosphodiesterase